VTALCKTGVEILTLFLALLPGKDLVRLLQMMGLSVHVHDAEIDNSVGAAGKKSTKEKVAMVAITFLRVMMGGTLDWWLGS
jgi:hypothetical protein